MALSLPQQLYASSPRANSIKPVTCLPPRAAVLVTVTATIPAPTKQSVVRRSGNYQPTIWKDDFVQSLSTHFKAETYKKRIAELKRDVKGMLSRVAVDPKQQLDLIDTLQRLGISYHFENEINEILDQICKKRQHDLYATALEFQLKRQRGFDISDDTFNGFRDERGNFKASVCNDIKGMLSLYEASFLTIEGETLLEEARYFTTKHLAEGMASNENELLSQLVWHSLELPLHWRMPRLEARWFIDIYQRKPDMNSTLLELATLDFNRVQSLHQDELKYTSRWWRNTGLAEKLSFGRDRLVENFLWSVGIGFEPQLGYLRTMTTKIAALITIIDDIYDVYGTLDELHLFTDAVERWDIDAMDQLPDYMQMCFFALHNTINEIAFDALREHGLHVIQCLRKTWVDLCKSYLMEAKWYHSNYTPTFQEYMDNAWISISGPLALVHIYVFAANTIKEVDLENLKDYPDIIRWSSMIFRLENDLGMSSDELKRGDSPKSIECYMNETGASREEAVRHMRHLMSETWKKLNQIGNLNSSSFSQTFVNCTVNLIRTAKFMYHHEQHGVEHISTREQVMTLLIQPLATS